LPRVIQHLASRDPAKGAWTIYVAVGILVKGNTDHYDLVARETTSAIMRMGMDHNLWVVNAVLACHNMTQVEERCMEEEYDHCVGPHMAQAVARLSLLARS
jgi:6,7-dimethyl-8-ribityllumazine synthase